MRTLAILVGLCCLWPPPAAAQTTPAPIDGIDRLVLAIEDAARSGQEVSVRGLARYDIDGAALGDFVSSLVSAPPTSVTVKERDRARLSNGRDRIIIEILIDRNREGQVSTWRLDVAPPVAATSAETPWQIAAIERLSVVSGLYRLSLDGGTEYDVRDLVIDAPDLSLSLPSGRAFLARTNDGPTALVLLGRGRMQFAPKPESERVQVRIFCGAEALSADFDAVYLRISPYDFAQRIASTSLTARPVDNGDLKRATQVFDNFLPRSFEIDLGDLSGDRWSLTPTMNDFVSEIVTKKYGALTYARSGSEPEDISFFDRQRHRNISIYASEAKLAQRGRFFSEDEQKDYDVVGYEVDATFVPERLWIDGVARLRLRTRDTAITTLTIKLAEPLVVRSITSPQFGRLLHLRVVRQSSVLVSLPAILTPGTEMELTVRYSGRLEPQQLDRETIAVQQDRVNTSEALIIPPEPNYLYSNNSFWYPQGTVTGYAEARLSISVPADFDVVATGTPQGPPQPVPPSLVLRRGGKRYQFATAQPVRYLACVISRFNATEAVQLNLPASTDAIRAPSSPAAEALRSDGGGAEASSALTLSVQANPRQFNRARGFTERATDILRFYTSLLGDAPYSSFTLALTESDLPGGHSPAYFAILHQPLPTSPYVWRNDPVSFDNYANFFLAHEIAHQWWGQAVGGKNYHEQWLSEGFAQYFAALYAERDRGPDQFASVVRQMRRWGVDMSAQGAVYLGYRLGHIKGEGRVFRALVYNKGAMVLHMLRRLVGDEAFFRGLRDFYVTWRFKKAGTGDFRAAMEKAAGVSLERFFERWIFGSAIPVVDVTWQADRSASRVAIRLEQRQDDVFDVAVTVTLSYADGTSEDLLVALTGKVTERTVPLKRALREIDVNRDGAALVEIREGK